MMENIQEHLDPTQVESAQKSRSTVPEEKATQGGAVRGGATDPLEYKQGAANQRCTSRGAGASLNVVIVCS